jgi:hypothetical protein
VEGAEAGAAAAAVVPDTAGVQVMEEEATVLQHALQGVVVYHQPQLVDAAIAGHRSVHGRRLPMITDTAAAGARARYLCLMSVL